MLERGPELTHGAFDVTHERCVTRSQHRLERLKSVEIGRQRQLLGSVAIARPIGGEALCKLRARHIE